MDGGCTRLHIAEVVTAPGGVLYSVLLGRVCACCAADCPLRAALRVRTLWLACSAAGWSPPGGRARSESVSAPWAMLAWPVSIERIDLQFSHLSHVAVKQPQSVITNGSLCLITAQTDDRHPAVNRLTVGPNDSGVDIQICR
jgi:hypothetical protein